ncbi:hypothetical protein POV26_13825 [Aequorivita todarodis]|uniref:DUF6939 family protein n=1 Tax=Aequorivita todarodis TaxID=2036821 RepID=UPI0023508943|nr:hypothetical protein [Aequorivita todarodis]MDC8002120.1 hypothetical protein [Aequorivita todarodis]
MIFIENKKKKEKTLLAKYPNAKIVDVTSKATTNLLKLSPFYPHGDIPIPFSEKRTAKSVEGIWQALKVFDSADIDEGKFQNDKMKDIKRTVRKYGKPLGHRKGVNGKELLNYIDARIQIYLPSYLWVLENKVSEIVERLKEASQKEDIVLLDYETNCDVLNPKKPLSHAFLVKAYVEGVYPKAIDLYRELKQRKLNPQEEKPKKKTTKPITKKTQNKKDDNQTTLF